MLSEELKSIEYSFTDNIFMLYINGIEVWRITRSEFANSITESGGHDIYSIRIIVGNGELVFAIFPRFKSQTVKIVGPLRFDTEKYYTLSDEKTDWLIGVVKIKSEFGSKERAILDKMIDEYKRKVTEYKNKIKEYGDKISEYENIIKLLEKTRRDKK